MSQSDCGTRATLLVRLRDPSDNASWQLFVDTYGPLLYHYCRRRGLQDADAADVAQDTLAELVRAIRTFEYRPEIGRFRNWLGTLVFRKLSRFRERQQRREVVTGSSSTADDLPQVADPAPDSAWTDEFQGQLLRVALTRIQAYFEPLTWRAFERVWVEKQSAAQVAEELTLSIGKVYQAKSRVLKRLEEEVLMLAEDAPLHLGAAS
jgi:RNA polymerase sigma-70 factor (ECF subfamily)